jgi:2-keto-3-deoxy-L-rhamnonate aldolase RhmA
MRLSLSSLILAFALVAPLALPEDGAAQSTKRLNPMIELHEQGAAIFGLYAPANRRGRRGASPGAQRTPTELAVETLGFNASDFVFNGSMERGVDAGLPAWSAYVDALIDAGAKARTHPLVVKAPKISEDPAGAVDDISRLLNSGVMGVMFVGVESAEEVRQGLAAMRFRSRGGSRPDDVGSAPAYWGLTEEEYRDRADLWPLNPDGELINWTIVESHAGLENVRQIAAVEGIGVLWPGAGTLRGLFSTTGPDGRRQLDEEAWEAAIQKVLAACKEFDVPCGYPANANDVEERIEQGFSVFVMSWGEGGFETIDIGRRATHR